MLRDVVYKRIKRAVKNKTYTQNKDLVKFVEIIPDVLEQAHFLKQAKMYKEACNLLGKNKLYSNAYRICRAQHFFDKGVEIADSVGVKHKSIKHSMILLMVEHQLVSSKAPEASLHEQLRKDLETVLMSTDLEPKQKARAYLLSSALTSKSNIEADRKSAMKICTDTLEMYKTLRSKAGEIEAFHMLTKMRVQRGEHTVHHGVKLLETITKVEKVCALLKKHAATFTTDLSDIEDFYGLEKHGSKIYCIPSEHGYFFSALHYN